MAPELSFDELHIAWKNVSTNKGMAGSDGVTVKQFQQNLRRNLNDLAQEWLQGSYQPKSYRTVTISKLNKNQRELAVPAVRDRIIHTAITQQRSTPSNRNLNILVMIIDQTVHTLMQSDI